MLIVRGPETRASPSVAGIWRCVSTPVTRLIFDTTSVRVRGRVKLTAGKFDRLSVDNNSTGQGVDLERINDDRRLSEIRLDGCRAHPGRAIDMGTP